MAPFQSTKEKEHDNGKQGRGLHEETRTLFDERTPLVAGIRCVPQRTDEVRQHDAQVHHCRDAHQSGASAGMKIGVRLLGLIMLPLSPVVALWALYVFRSSKLPKDHSYFHVLRGLVEECWGLITTGEFFGNE